MMRLFCFAIFCLTLRGCSPGKIPPFLKLHDSDCNVSNMKLLASFGLVNATFSPCSDFYGYSCAPWTSQLKKPPSEPLWSPWIAVGHEIRRRIIKILASPEPALIKPQLFYQSCISVAHQEKKYLDDLIALVDNLGGWPLIKDEWEGSGYDWFDHLGQITRLGIHPILKIHVDLDYKNPKRFGLYLEPGNLVLPQYVLANSDRKTEMEAYRKWVFETARHMYGAKLDHVIDDQIREMIKFETRLAKFMTIKSKNERISLGKLSRILSMDFLRTLGIFFEDRISLNTTIMVKNMAYMKKLFVLIENTDKRVIANYLAWSIIKDFSRDTTDHMRKLNFLINQAVLGIEDDLSREHECANQIVEHFSSTLVTPYAKSFVKPQTVAMVTSMWASIKSEFVKILMNSDWLSAEAKLLSAKKVKNVKIHVGFPSHTWQGESLKNQMQVSDDHFLNILLLKIMEMAENLARLGETATVPLWPSSPFDVNAYYSVLQNSIFIPLGLLEPPFFDPNRPQIANFGALGSLLGHELSHALDPAGIKADVTGRIAKWFPDEDLAAYETRLQCFKQDDLLGESIADGNGIRISLAAAQKHDPARRTSRMFFISYAQIWCEISGLGDLFGDDEHAPVSERVRNLDIFREFGEAFGCEVKDSCTLW